MRKWYLPVAVFGLGSLGLLVLTERGREAVTWLVDQLEQAPERLQGFNEVAQQELDRIELALNQLAESLNAA